MLNSKPRHKQKKSRQEINESSRELKRERKRKGLPKGSRFNVGNSDKKNHLNQSTTDKRIGSKKPIPLIIDSDKQKTDSPLKNERLLPPKNMDALSRQQAEKELATLENDPLLDTLLDMKEQNEKLNQEQSTYLTEKLSRIEALMTQLGYLDDEELQEDEQTDRDSMETTTDIVQLLKMKE